MLDEQLSYYRARAPEYDEWFYRKGRYDLGPVQNARWFEEVDVVRTALAGLRPVRSALELACGTGLWTVELVRFAISVTAVDGAPEMLALNRERIGPDRVRYVEADLFEWEPDATYDLVFIGFWVSHVPRQVFGAFWAKLARALEPGGRVFLVDNLAMGSPIDHRDENTVDGTMVRELKDGRSFRIVKHFYDPASLAAALEPLGWSADLRKAGHFLLYGTVTR